MVNGKMLVQVMQLVYFVEFCFILLLSYLCYIVVISSTKVNRKKEISMPLQVLYIYIFYFISLCKYSTVI